MQESIGGIEGRGMIGKFIGELKRRNVPRAALLYVGSVWALAQGIAQLAPEIGAPEALTRWFLIAAAVGFPFWIAVSWRYELTSQGFKLEHEHAPSEHEDRVHKRRTDLLIIGVLSIAVVLLLTDRVMDRTSDAAVAAAAIDGNSIAVLPFVNQSSDKDQQYFSDGLSEGFIIALSRVDGLRIINRQSSFQFRDSEQGSQAIAKALGVGHLLEGSVRRSGETVRISASLTRATDGATVWAESFDRPYKDLFALQDQITARVAEALKAKLLPAPDSVAQGDRPPSSNLDAYNAFLQGKSASNSQEAIKWFDRATQIDPSYGLAYSLKARTWIDAVSGGLTGDDAAHAFAEAEAAVDLAVKHAPEQASTHIARGYLLMMRDFDWSGAERELGRAVELAPEDGEALFQLGVVRASQGDLKQAVDLTRKALSLDPLNANWQRWLVAYLMPLGRLDEAEQVIGKTIRQKPGDIYNHHLLAIVKVLRKDHAGARKAAESEPEGAWRDFALALAAQIGPDRAAADRSLDDVTSRYAQGWAFQVAQVHAVRGEPDAMFEWLERAWKARDPGMQSLLYDALLLRYKDDPRYAALAKKVGLPWPPAGQAAPATGP